MTQPPTPDAILQTAFGFWNSKVLLSGVELGLFTALAERRLTAAELGQELDIHPRGRLIFLRDGNCLRGPNEKPRKG